jgi:hypothetical protein
MQNRRISAQTVKQWQQQAMLVCCVPELRGHDAQLIVACDIFTAEQLATLPAAELFARIRALLATKHGRRILRQGQEPSLDEVQRWIQCARFARRLAA